MRDMTLLIILSIGGLGLFVFYLGWYRRVVDGGRYCRRCNYRIDPLGPNVVRCPECGSGLQARGTVLPYQRKRSAPLVALGLVLILLSAGTAVTDALWNIRPVDIYRYLPSWYLLRADVSPDEDYANEQVDVLRDRVQDDRLSESQLITFTNMLCRRATNLHRYVTGGGMNYTGMTANLLKEYKPDAPLVDELMQALFTQLLEYSSFDARIDSGRKKVVVRFPMLVFNPVQPFLTSTELTSCRMRGEIVGVEMSQGGSTWIKGETRFDGLWHAEVEDPQLEPGLPISLRLQINWHIEDEMIAADHVGNTPGEAQPWHRFEYLLELETDTDPRAPMLLNEDGSPAQIPLRPVFPDEQ